VTPPEVCVVGEINPDLILSGLPRDLLPEREVLIDGLHLTLGSSSAIFAHNLAALGTRVAIVSRIGKDAWGDLSLRWLEERGVDTSGVSAVEGAPTGITVILARPDYRFILTFPGTMFELRYEDLDLERIFQVRHLHVSSFFLHRGLRPRLPDLFRQAKEKGLSTSLDTNDDPADLWGKDLVSVLPFVDILFPNEREALKISRSNNLTEAVQKLSRTCPVVVVKCGPQGALARTGEKEFRSGQLRVPVKDTVGAGDSFDAGFLHRFLEGATIEECLDFANLAGAFSTTREGGIEAFRDAQEMHRFFSEHPSH
jgi:sugar/nucleoside kinase (ribokinase family)